MPGTCNAVLRVVRIEVLRDEAQIRIGSFGETLFIAHLRPVTTGSLRVLDQAEAQFLEGRDRINLFTIMAAPIIMNVDPALKEESVRMEARFRDRVRAHAFLVPHGGLSAAVARTFMTAFNLLTRPPHPFKVFRECDPALEWLCAVPGQAASFADAPTLAPLCREAERFWGADPRPNDLELRAG